jgi:penicillin G amidase
MNQARSWEEFREAVTYNHIPPRTWSGPIGRGTSAGSPGDRPHPPRDFSGLVPVPGDGRYEWDGFLPIDELPWVVNPPEGYFGTANANLTSPFDYPHLDEAIYYRVGRPVPAGPGGRCWTQGGGSISWTWWSCSTTTSPSRPGPWCPFSGTWRCRPRVEEARRKLLDWDHVLEPESVAAGSTWSGSGGSGTTPRTRLHSQEGQRYLSVGLKRLIDFLLAPPGEFGRAGPGAGRPWRDGTGSWWRPWRRRWRC